MVLYDLQDAAREAVGRFDALSPTARQADVDAARAEMREAGRVLRRYRERFTNVCPREAAAGTAAREKWNLKELMESLQAARKGRCCWVENGRVVYGRPEPSTFAARRAAVRRALRDTAAAYRRLESKVCTCGQCR